MQMEQRNKELPINFEKNDTNKQKPLHQPLMVSYISNKIHLYYSGFHRQ